jgi:hypothetical protein
VQSNATHTQVRRARAVLEINKTRHPLQPPGLVVGRGTEADVRSTTRREPPAHRVRRAHDVRARARTTSRSRCRDLGSTNGMLIDGHKVTKAGVRDGSQVRIRSTHDDGADPPRRRGRRRAGAGVRCLSSPWSSSRIAYLPPLLWIFSLLSAISVIRSDMFWRRVHEAARAPADNARHGEARRRQAAPKRRGAPPT